VAGGGGEHAAHAPTAGAGRPSGGRLAAEAAARARRRMRLGLGALGQLVSGDLWGMPFWRATRE
jgi:hypothetical protein